MIGKHVPITVFVPGTFSPDELNLTPGEAKLLRDRLDRELARWKRMRAKYGKRAGGEMCAYYDRRRS